MEEIVKRVGTGPVRFKYVAQIAEKGDKLDDPSIAWPDDRKTVELGTIEIDKAVADNHQKETEEGFGRLDKWDLTAKLG